MDIVLMILYGIIILSILVFVHEGGHYLTARAFKVRVTEFMIGLPGPSIGFTKKGTRFGVTAIPLGGYARICGMSPGELSPHMKEVLAYSYKQGTVVMEDVALVLDISNDEALTVLDDLVEWGSLVGPTKKDEFNVYRTPQQPGTYELGQARLVDDAEALYESEYSQQYRSLPFWKRSVILLSGVAVNILFAIVLVVLLFIVAYSIFGAEVQNPQTGEMQYIKLTVLQSIQAGFATIINYIGLVATAVAGLFNPATAAETVSNSTSIMGIAVYSKDYVDAGAIEAVWFTAMISVSLGIMNLLPIPPLDGGRFVIEVVQKIFRRNVPEKVVGYMTTVGVLLFLGLFVVLINQDIQRFVFGNW